MSRSGLILAAGLATRFGGSKLSQPLGGSTIVGRAVAALQPHCERVFVVTGAHREAVRGALAAFPDVVFIYNDQFENGMFSSVLAGVAAVPEGDGLFILPGDIPLVHPETCGLLAEAAPGKVCVPSHGGRRGHPVFLPAGVVARLQAADPDSTLRDFLGEEGFVEIPVDDPGVLRDVDTREAYRDLQQ